MYRNSLEYRIILLELQSLGSVLSVLGSDVAGSTRHTAILVLGTFQYNLHPITFYLL